MPVMDAAGTASAFVARIIAIRYPMVSDEFTVNQIFT
jgi:hypothetical protein